MIRIEMKVLVGPLLCALLVSAEAPKVGRVSGRDAAQKGPVKALVVPASERSGKKPREYVRTVPPLAELLELKQREQELREKLAEKSLSAEERLSVQVSLVQCLEAAGEDPLPEFSTLCQMAARSERLGPEKAWGLASENIALLYDQGYFSECYRYCRMVESSEWADEEARAWVLLRMLCCDRHLSRVGAVRCLSHRLMMDYPSTEAARSHTRAAVLWLVADTREDRALQLLEEMGARHRQDIGFLAKCHVWAAEITQRLGRVQAVLRRVEHIEALARREKGVPEATRKYCLEQAAVFRRWLERHGDSEETEKRRLQGR